MNILCLIKIVFIVALWGIANENHSKADIMIPGTTCIGKYKMYYIHRHMKIMNRSFSLLHCEHCEDMPQTIILNNTSETIEMNFIYSDVDSIPTLTQGPLAGKGAYRFKHAYFSWVLSLPDLWDVTNTQFNAEMHLVFYNTKHGDYVTAQGERDGIAVVAFPFKVRPWITNKEFDLVTDGLQTIRIGESNTSIQAFPLSLLLPDVPDEYYTYIGGLVLPNKPECVSDGNVIWIELVQALKITPEHAEKFQELQTSYSVKIVQIVKMFEQPNTIIYKSTESLDASAATAVNKQCLSYAISIFILIINDVFQNLEF